jgi:hypothetical protein
MVGFALRAERKMKEVAFQSHTHDILCVQHINDAVIAIRSIWQDTSAFPRYVIQKTKAVHSTDCCR